MQFEVSERVYTDKSEDQVMSLALASFQKISKEAKFKSDLLIARGIEATFGSVNRADKTVVSAKEADGGWLLVAEVTYRPSVFFWIMILLLFFTWVGWIVPIIFYLTQKGSVRKAVEACLHRVSSELNRSIHLQSVPTAAPVIHRPSALDELEKLANLKERGFITDEEFASQKLQFLRRS